MPEHDYRRRLRVLLAEDANAFLDALANEWPGDALQLVGDGLIRAGLGGSTRATEPARRCATELRSRDWEGDAELAEVLEARVGTGAVPLRRPIAVDLDDLAMVLEGDAVFGGGRIDLRTAEVWPASVLEYARDTGELVEDEDEDDDRWLEVECQGSRDGYRDMELFAARVDEADLRRRLERALTGRRVFRRFKDVLAESPSHFQEWFAFSEERQHGRARAWLAWRGLQPDPVTRAAADRDHLASATRPTMGDSGDG